jgi:Sybindin-like family
LHAIAAQVSALFILLLFNAVHHLNYILLMSMLCLPQVAPLVSSGIERLETDTFKLHSLQTLTGAKFVITAQLDTSDLEHVLQGIYELYTDYVLKVRNSTTQLVAPCIAVPKE